MAGWGHSNPAHLYRRGGASLLEVDKYALDESSNWRRVNARFPALYKALLVDPDAATRGARLRQAVSVVE